MSVRKYSKRSLDSLRGIHPDLRRVIDRALQESPLDFIVIEGLRTEDRQAEMVGGGGGACRPADPGGGRGRGPVRRPSGGCGRYPV